MVISAIWRRYLYSGKRHAATVSGVISIPAPSIECVTSRTVCHALVIQTVKEIVQLIRERYTNM
jgi:hypothetical protein